MDRPVNRFWQGKPAKSVLALNVEIVAHSGQAQGRFQLGTEVAHGEDALLIVQLSLHACNEPNAGRIYKLDARHVHHNAFGAAGEKLVERNAQAVYSAKIEDSRQGHDSIFTAFDG
ncbi:MAG TPA: hypothetical protein PKE49_11025, partial [Leptospiraceae bacterium]|nr:hypothetical protein [Leptospiraceae bacterium]